VSNCNCKSGVISAGVGVFHIIASCANVPEEDGSPSGGSNSDNSLQDPTYAAAYTDMNSSGSSGSSSVVDVPYASAPTKSLF
jgi:hypothetical protein